METTAFDYKSRFFLVLWILNFLLTFAIALISTPTPFLVREFVGDEDVQRLTAEALGIILTLGNMALTLGSFLGGFLADSLSRRTVVFTSFIFLAAGCGLFAVAPSLVWLYVASFIEMFASGFSSPAINALVADYSPQASRGKAYGIFNLSWITAQIPAPLLGGVVAQFLNLRIPFIIAVFVAVSSIPFSLLIRGGAAEKQKVIVEDVAGGKNEVRFTPFRRIIILFGLALLFSGLGNGVASPLLNVFPIFKLNADPTQLGLVFAIGFATVTALVQIPGGKLADRFGRKPVVLFSFVNVLVVFLLAFSPSLLVFILFLGIICAVGNLGSPAISAWQMDSVPKSKRASVSGMLRTLNGIGLMVGPVIGGWLWSICIPDAALPFAVVTLLFAASLPIYLMIEEPKKKVSRT